jgi:RNA polymerase sigma factor (sigma-70 family)
MQEPEPPGPHAVPPAEVNDVPVDERAIADLRIRLAKAVRTVCPPWLRSHAEDIAQLALIRVVGTEGTGGNRDLPASYLRKAAYSAVVDEIRRHVRRREVAVEEIPEVGSVPSRAADPERLARASEVGRALAGCLRDLLGARRLAVTLYLQGCTVPEVGRRLAWSTKKAEHLVYRALEQLRGCLTAKGLAP